MPFFLAYGIVAVAVFAITYKTYLGYSQVSLWCKILFTTFISVSILAPFIAHFIKNNYGDTSFAYLFNIFYFMFGFVFILFLITFIRDFFWMLIDAIKRTPLEQIQNPPHIGVINVITFIFSFALSLYGVYEATKQPRVLSYDIISPKIKKETKVVMLSDLHINTFVSTDTVSKLVKQVNDLKPDVVVLAGDIVDNSFSALKPQMAELKKLAPTERVYVALGNHEFYSGAFDWVLNFGYMKFEILANYGRKIGDTGIFIGGVPDLNAAPSSKMKISVEGALYAASKDDYVIMLSHTPKIAEGINKDNVDIILSGHTHGGQIYPFHYFVKSANEGRLAGFYDIDGVKMYISRGTRYWGPPMRIGAPSEITVFNFKPDNKNDEKLDK